MDKSYLHILLYLIFSSIFLYYCFKLVSKKSSETRITFMGCTIALFYSPWISSGGYFGMGKGSDQTSPIGYMFHKLSEFISTESISFNSPLDGNIFTNFILYCIFAVIYMFLYYLIDCVTSIKD